MSEARQVAKSRTPVTVATLRDDLKHFGIASGDVVLVHMSMSALGWVNGGPVAVIQALIAAVQPGGTIVMPAHSAGLSDPARWQAPPVPMAWQDEIRNTMPAYDRHITPTRQMGQVAELFRTWPGVLRSEHPSASFAALGPMADEITGVHQIDDPMGERSPLGALYRLGAKVLLIGVGFDRCTCLHLAERRAWPGAPTERNGAPMTIEGERRWVSFDAPQLIDSDHFIAVGASGIAAKAARRGELGAAMTVIADMRALVDHAVATWRASSYPD